MKKLLAVTAISLVALAACETPKPAAPSSPAGLKKVTKEQITAEAAAKCQTLGFDPGTKDFRDCTVKQFDKLQDKYF